jgi:hypothetical protein
MGPSAGLAVSSQRLSPHLRVLPPDGVRQHATARSVATPKAALHRTGAPRCGRGRASMSYIRLPPPPHRRDAEGTNPIHLVGSGAAFEVRLCRRHHEILRIRRAACGRQWRRHGNEPKRRMPPRRRRWCELRRVCRRIFRCGYRCLLGCQLPCGQSPRGQSPRAQLSRGRPTPHGRTRSSQRALRHPRASSKLSSVPA